MIALFAVLLSFSAPISDSIPYQLTNPSLSIRFEDDALKELSGLGPTDRLGIFVGINDEEGAAYFIDINQGGKVIDRVQFKDKGDFEGIEMAGQCIYAVKSNGQIFEIGCWQDRRPAIESYDTPLTKEDDVEGLCYDPSRKALLLACKGNPENEAPRNVWAFDLITKELSQNPVFSVNPKEVNALVPYGPEEKHDNFSPSGIAIHPITKEIYMVSTALKRLVVLDPAGERVLYAERLDKKLLPQPESISFDPTGNLYIGSEGKKEQGILLKFDWQKQIGN